MSKLSSVEQIREYLKKGRSFQRRIKCRIKKNESNSQVDAVVLWFELHLLDKNKYDKTSRSSKSKRTNTWGNNNDEENLRNSKTVDLKIEIYYPMSP